MNTEPISSPTSDYEGFPGVRKRKRPERLDDAVYPGEEKVEIEVEQLEAHQKMVEEIEGKLTLLKGVIKFVSESARPVPQEIHQRDIQEADPHADSDDFADSDGRDWGVVGSVADW